MEIKHDYIDDIEMTGNIAYKNNVKTKNILSIIIIIIVLIIGSIIYSKYNYHDFTKSVREKGKTSFSRDNGVKYSDDKSYKVENKEYNDAMFYKNIEVKPNTPYRVTCKVKTEGVVNQEQKYYGGAQIAIKDTTECSQSVTGTSEWTTLTFMFNSKNRTSVDIGFRLGGYDEMSKGTAWFSDLKIEEGSLDSDNTWNVACFIIENTNLNLNINNATTNINVRMSDSDIDNIENNMERLSTTVRNLSGSQMDMTYRIINIETPLTSISYDEKNEYYIDPADAKPLMEEYLEKEEYDYIFVVIRLGNLTQNKNVLVHDWVGLGGMDYYGIGFSNIRLPDNENSYLYTYNSSINTFPEEIYLHEFLHTLERNEKEYGNTNIANLHDYEKYGYNRESLIGLRNWYGAYMKNTIKNSDGTGAGLTSNIYTSKPIHESNFNYSYELNDLDEPQNLIEEINSIVNKFKKLFE